MPKLKKANSLFNEQVKPFRNHFIWTIHKNFDTLFPFTLMEWVMGYGYVLIYFVFCVWIPVSLTPYMSKSSFLPLPMWVWIRHAAQSHLSSIFNGLILSNNPNPIHVFSLRAYSIKLFSDTQKKRFDYFSIHRVIFKQHVLRYFSLIFWIFIKLWQLQSQYLKANNNERKKMAHFSFLFPIFICVNLYILSEHSSEFPFCFNNFE